jgi:hypothetical protein
MKSLVLFAGLIAVASAFNITDWSPRTALKVNAGESFNIQCEVDDWYQTCLLRHVESNKTCGVEYKTSSDDDAPNCTDFKGRYNFTGDNYNYNCSFLIKAVKVEDAGAWKCEITDYDEPTKAPVYKTFQVEVVDQPEVNQTATPIEEDQTAVNQTATPIEKDQPEVNQTATPIEEDQTAVNQTATPIEEDQTRVNQNATPIEEDQTRVNQTIT